MTEEIRAIITEYQATEGLFLNVGYTGDGAIKYRDNNIPLAHGPALRDALNERFPVTPPEPEPEPEPEQPFRVWPRPLFWKVSREDNGVPIAVFYYGKERDSPTREDTLAKATKLAEELNVEDRERKTYRLDEGGGRMTIKKKDGRGGWWPIATFHYDAHLNENRGITRADAEAEARALLAKLNAKR